MESSSNDPAVAEPPLKALIKILTDFWQAIAAVVGLVTATIGAMAYFATNAQLDRLECITNQNLLRQTLPARIQQLGVCRSFNDPILIEIE